MVPAIVTHPGADELDELTLRRAQNGEPAAFRALVELHTRAIWELGVRMLFGTGLEHRAEDVVQETFVRIHRALGRFDPSGPARLSTWIRTIATNVLFDELRAAPRVERTVDLDHASRVADGAEGAVDTISSRRRSTQVARAVAALPEHHRVVLVLREYQDLDYGEIAAVLGIDIGTVKSRISRARAQLRGRLSSLEQGALDG
jgi:RNA polymerase sigma-70 factor, ECF subfamily